MARKAQKKAYAVRLNKDPVGRTQIAILRMAGFSSQKIADLTGRHERTINQELTRPEHKQIFQTYVASVGKKQLPEKEWGVVENALNQEGVIQMAGKKSGKRARSAITGRFVSKGAAKRHPKTTVVETVKKRKKS